LALPPGARFGVHDTIAPVGSDGVGEVHPARATRSERARGIAVENLAVLVLPGGGFR